MGNSKNKRKKGAREARKAKAFNENLAARRRNARSQLGKTGKFEKKIVRADPFHDSKGLCDVNDLHVDEKTICSLCDREAECQHDEQTKFMSWYCVECMEGHNIHLEWWESDNDNEDEDGSDQVECGYFNDHTKVRVAACAADLQERLGHYCAFMPLNEQPNFAGPSAIGSWD